MPEDTLPSDVDGRQALSSPGEPAAPAFAFGFGAAALATSVVALVGARAVSRLGLTGALVITVVAAAAGALLPPADWQRSGGARTRSILQFVVPIAAFLLPTWIALTDDGAVFGVEVVLRSVTGAVLVAMLIAVASTAARVAGVPRGSVDGAAVIVPVGLLVAGFAAEEYLATASRLALGPLAFCIALAAAPIALAAAWEAKSDRRLWVRASSALVTLSLLAASAWFTTSAFSRLYPRVHLAANMTAGLAASILLARVARPTRADRRRLLAWGVAVVAMALLVRLSEPIRFFVLERTPLGHAICYATPLTRIVVPDIATPPLSAVVPRSLSFAPEVPTPPPQVIVFISIDAMRADRFADDRVLPAAFGWFAGGMRFENARTPYTSTYSSLRAIAGGEYFGWDEPVTGRRLLDVLRDAGYRTAVVNLPAERARIGTVDEGAVLDDTHVESEEATRLALEFVDALAGQKFFLWVHYFDAHSPVRVPEDLAASARTTSERYDAALTGVDRAIAPLLRRLDEPDLAGRVLVSLFSDHGEEQGEHGGSFHNTSVYEELARVPLAFRGPGVVAGVSGEEASLVDLWQTLARLVGPGDPGSPSQDLWPVLAGGAARARVVATELDSTAGQRHTAIIAGRWKAIVNARSGTRELYDLVEDALERAPILADDPDRELPAPIRRFLGWDR